MNRVRFLRKDEVGGSIVRHRTQAEREGYRLQVVETVDELEGRDLDIYREAGGE